MDVFLRVRPTTSDEAESYARSAFGAVGLETESLAGGTMYFNGCFDQTSGCHPAVAVSLEPILLIATANWHDARDELRALATSIISEAMRDEVPATSPGSARSRGIHPGSGPAS